MPACICSVCRSGKEKNIRTRTSALISAENGTQILIDTSSDFRQQALRRAIQRIDAVLYTHYHADHILGLEDLRGYNFAQQGPIPAYGTQNTISEIRRCFNYVFEPNPNYDGGGVPQIETHLIDDTTPFEVKGFLVRPFQLQHGLTVVTGYRIGEMAYATDCKILPEATYETLTGVRVLVLDGLRYEPHKAHLTIPEACAVAQRISAERTFLTHMTHSIDYDDVSAKLPAGVELAYDGLVVDFKY